VNDSYELDGLLDRYLSGEAAQAEEERLRSWMEDDPRRVQLVAAFRAMWADGSQFRRGTVLDDAWRRVADRIALEDSAATAEVSGLPHGVSSRPLPGRRRPVLALALRAAAIAAAALGGWLWHAGAIPPEALVATAWDERTTARGEFASIGLPDGSRVVVGPESKIRFSTSRRARRQVHLTGEAYFEIVDLGGRPFTVHAAHAAVRVLGTRFGVRAYATDTLVRISVAEGRVIPYPVDAIETRGRYRWFLKAAPLPSHLPELTAGMVADVGTGGDIHVQADQDVEGYLGWRRGELRFRDTPLTEVAEVVGRTFDIVFIIEEPHLGARRFTGLVQRQGLQSLVESLSMSMGLTYEINQRVVTLRRTDR
jgi:transmembrane sensor